jgi:hypothetical protein
LPTSTTVASITNATTIVVSQAAAATSSVTATIFPWGNGDQVSTFNIPDLRGGAAIGADCMGFVASGNTCKGRLTTAFYGANPGCAGQLGGSQSKNIGIANINRAGTWLSLCVRSGKSRVRAMNFAILPRHRSFNFSRSKKRYQTRTVSHWLRKIVDQAGVLRRARHRSISSICPFC